MVKLDITLISGNSCKNFTPYGLGPGGSNSPKFLLKFINLLSSKICFLKTKTKFLIISFTSDWLYPTSENKEIVIALNAIGADVTFVEIESDKGHDSFLLNVPDFLKALKNFLDKSYTE